ncbi:MAG: hypothetical protein ACF8NJ_01640, partial [Phycisphaerales bacterium JB038]
MATRERQTWSLKALCAASAMAVAFGASWVLADHASAELNDEQATRGRLPADSLLLDVIADDPAATSGPRLEQPAGQAELESAETGEVLTGETTEPSSADAGRSEEH